MRRIKLTAFIMRAQKMFKKILLMAIVLYFPYGAYAQEQKEEPEALYLEEIVVTATRGEREVWKIPLNVTIITKEDIANSNARTVLDLLYSQEGLKVSDWFGKGTKAEVGLRGFGEAGASNCLVMIDGRRINEIDMSNVDWNQIPLDQVERIEIVRGASGVLYGDNATGGVINIITKSGVGKPRFEAYSSYSSYFGKEGGIAISGGKEQYTYSLRASHSSTDGYRKNSEYSARDFGTKFEFNPKEVVKLSLSGSYHGDRFGLPGWLDGAELESGVKKPTDSDYLDDDAENEDWFTQLSMSLLGKSGYLETGLSFRNRESDSYWLSYGVNSSIDKRESQTWGLREKGVWDWKGKNRLTIGMDLYFTEFLVKTFKADMTPQTKTTINRNTWEAYLVDEFSPFKSIILNLGGRWTRAKYRFDFKDLTGTLESKREEPKKDLEAYHAGISWLLRERNSFFVKVARSFRLPKTDEYFQSGYPAYAIPAKLNEDLQPQKANHIETGVKSNLWSNLSTRLSYFWMDVKDEIYYDKPTWTNKNYPKTRHQGIELGMRFQPVIRLTFEGNYTFTEALFKGGDYNGKEIPAVPMHQASISYNLNLGRGLRLNLNGNYVGERRFVSDLNNKLDRMKDYILWRAKISYQWKEMKIFGGVDNIFNEKYSEYGVTDSTATTKAYYPSPERNFTVGASLSF